MSRRDESGDPADLRYGLIVVFLLSSFAGAVDAYGLYLLKDLFVSFMSGNTTSLGLALGKADVARALLILSILVAFTAGATGGGLLAIALGRHHLPGVVLFVAACLTLGLASPHASIYAMSFAMGALNAALDHVGEVKVSLTYITGALVKLGRGLALSMCRRTKSFDWLQQAVPWLGILGGASAASLCIARLGWRSFIAMPILAAALSIVLFGATLLQDVRQRTERGR